jgi:hypothetical protein
MNYLVAVLTDRSQAESAYNALQENDLPLKQISVLGKGYQSADDYGLIHPDRQASLQSRRLSYWLIPFGFVAGFAFNLLTGIEIVSQWGGLGNHLLGGCLGAASGALGAYVAGTIGGWTAGSGDALAYRNRLNAGKYLIIAEGNRSGVRQATRILRQFEPENLQGYADTDPAGASE